MVSSERFLASAEVTDERDEGLDQQTITQMRDVFRRGSDSADQFVKMLETISDLGPSHVSGLSYEDQADRGGRRYMEARRALDPGMQPAEDLEYLLNMYDALMTVDPLAYAATSGNEALVLTALRDAAPSPEITELMERVAVGSHMGVFLLTERIAGSKANDIQITATLDIESGKAVLNTPNSDASKFMPNVADEAMPKVTLVAARLIVEGVDQGMVTVAVPMHTHDEPAGISMERMGDKSYSTPMPHADKIFYDNVEVPLGNVILGHKARIENNQYVHDDPLTGDEATDRRLLGARHREALAPLWRGRLGLVSGTAAGVQAALMIHTHYAQNREVGRGQTISDQDDWRLDIAKGVIDTCAISALSGFVSRRFAEAPEQADNNELLAWLEKPTIKQLRDVLITLIDRSGARGHFDANRMSLYLKADNGGNTAEGDGRVMEIAAGRSIQARQQHGIELPTAIAQRDMEHAPLCDQLVVLRAENLAQQPDFSLGGNRDAINLAQATLERFTLDIIAGTAENSTGKAREVWRTIADLYALERIEEHYAWYHRNGYMTEERGQKLQTQRVEKYQEFLKVLPQVIEAFGIPKEYLDVPMMGEPYAAQPTY